MVVKHSKQHILCFGEIMLRLSSPFGERLLQSSIFETHFGGAEANVAVALQSMGISSEFVTSLPNNRIGDACLAFLRALKVDNNHTQRSDDARLGTYYAEQGHAPRATQITYDRAYSSFANLTPSNFEWSRLLKNTTGLHISGINLVIGDGPYTACLKGAETATKNEKMVSFDVNRRPSLTKDLANLNKAYERLLPCITHLFASPAEIAHLLGDTQHTDIAHLTEAAYKTMFTDMALAAFKAMPRLAFIGTTCRIREKETEAIFSALASREEVAFSTPHMVRNTVDRIGSGDAFAAACLYGCVRKMPLFEIKDFALAASLLKRTLKGDVLRATVEEIKALAFDGSQSRSINR